MLVQRGWIRPRPRDLVNFCLICRRSISTFTCVYVTTYLASSILYVSAVLFYLVVMSTTNYEFCNSGSIRLYSRFGPAASVSVSFRLKSTNGARALQLIMVNIPKCALVTVVVQRAGTDPLRAGHGAPVRISLAVATCAADRVCYRLQGQGLPQAHVRLAVSGSGCR